MDLYTEGRARGHGYHSGEPALTATAAQGDLPKCRLRLDGQAWAAHTPGTLHSTGHLDVRITSQNPCLSPHFSRGEQGQGGGVTFPASLCAGLELDSSAAALESEPGLGNVSVHRAGEQPGPWALPASLGKVTHPFISITAGTSPLWPQGGSSIPAITEPRPSR